MVPPCWCGTLFATSALHRATERTIPSLPKDNGSAQRDFVPGDLDLCRLTLTFKFLLSSDQNIFSNYNGRRNGVSPRSPLLDMIISGYGCRNQKPQRVVVRRILTRNYNAIRWNGHIQTPSPAWQPLRPDKDRTPLYNYLWIYCTTSCTTKSTTNLQLIKSCIQQVRNKFRTNRQSTTYRQHFNMLRCCRKNRHLQQVHSKSITSRISGVRP